MLNFMDLEKKTEGVVKGLKKDLTKLNQKSEDALQSFRDTMINLQEVNQEIDWRVEMASKHIIELTQLQGTLLDTRAANVKIHDKIMDFLGIDKKAD
jgi:hypothetical protein